MDRSVLFVPDGACDGSHGRSPWNPAKHRAFPPRLEGATGPRFSKASVCVSFAIIAVILGIIEGLTEFLPVSSTGHLIIAMPLLGVAEDQQPWRILLIVCQLGAIAAVLLYFWRELWAKIFHPKSSLLSDHIGVKLIVAMIPSVIVGLAFHDLVERYLENPPSVAFALIAGAIAIEFIDRRYRRTTPMTLEDVTLFQAFLVGIAQTLSILWPGLSRAGCTIMGGMVIGLSPVVATEFSFLLAIPTMFAAGAKQILKYRHDLTADNAAIVLISTATAFVVALAVVAVFMGFVQRRRFTVFSVYRVLLGGAVLAWYFANRH